jgi:hypothetical protein
MHRALVLTGSLLLPACAPQNASLTGEFTAFLADGSSITLQRDNLKLGQFERNYAVDCRDFATARNEEENEELRLDDRLQICQGDVDENGVTIGRDDWPPTHETWLADSGFVVVGEPLDPWRGEGIITSEGDVQIGFHHRLPGGPDFRFAIVVDPDFQPRSCVQAEDGEGVSYEPVDGDWVENWSTDLQEGETGRLFYLHAGSYQFNPSRLPSAADPSPPVWFLPNEWLAGYSRGRFADDDFRVRPPRYATPETYFSYDSAELAGDAATVRRDDLFFCSWAGEEADPDYAVFDGCMVNQFERAEEIADEVAEEFELVDLQVESESLPSMRPRIHPNLWRTPNTNAAGLDGWVEFHYSWIRFDEGSDLSTGGAATGEFQMVFDAFDSASRFFVRGSFDVKRFKRDTWTTEYLPPVKFEEAGTTQCGSPVLPPDNF